MWCASMLAKALFALANPSLAKPDYKPGSLSELVAIVLADEKLSEFAAKRKIDTTAEDWRLLAICEAAAKHPELDPYKRKRGRPRKKSGGVDMDKIYAMAVDKIKENAKKEGGPNKMTDAEAIRRFVRLERPNIRDDDTQFTTRVNQLKNKVSAVRTRRKRSSSK